MKKFFVLALGLMFVTGAMASGVEAKPKKGAEQPEGIQFTGVKEKPITSIKNQNRAGTCWCYSSLAFIESELLRMGKGEYDFSEMFIVHNTYLDRAEKAVRTHGDVSFAQGGSFYDVIYGMEAFGLVPEAEMRPGVMYGMELSNHNELSAVSDAVVAAIAKGKLRSLQVSPDGEMLWKKSIEAIHDIYLGVRPEKFTYEGVEYTPKSFYESLGLNASDYVSWTSCTHHPFYTTFALEIPDNWRWAQSYNLPIDELMEVFDNAIMNGYTVAWASDVSEAGFNRQGLGIVPDVEGNRQEAGSDEARWIGKSPEEQNAILNNTNAPGKELKITQELRQEGYDGVATSAEGLLKILQDNGGVLPVGDDSTPEQIHAATQMSKKVFKRAVGMLLKRGAITADKYEIREK